ncbi:hypothetical protein D9756_005801 [Leucocoprinus leucothites]|uniref:Uncharacterized protein n=1 Tax=Leucocoprinus leucothites TaxID=201217 RepID=A0A8H5FX40_9AGAR|nr:hypothetical protein D9756_005801 [Leucoagaricus leucothites]
MESGVVSLIDSRTVLKVSSTLDKSVGKKHLTDGDVETCWTSQQGLPQSIQLMFADSVLPQRVSLVFQGGFVGTRCSVWILDSADSTQEWRVFTNIYPEDVNRRQTFDLQPIDSCVKIDDGVQAIKFLFEESSDFFGRITIYDLKVEGLVKSSVGANSKAGH